ncbi:hypothetical protein QUB72_08450 [Enterococcus faecium]|nr:hypothetical protein [Enterococcus faecium]
MEGSRDGNSTLSLSFISFIEKRGYGTQMNPLFYQKLMTTEEVSGDRKK